MNGRNETAQPAPLGQVERGVGRLGPERATATPLMRSMLSRAAHIGASGRALVTEWVGRNCVQCKGRMVQRRTLDGWQPVVAFSWLIDSRRASKVDVWRLTSKTPNVNSRTPPV
jgi:hypothetical protein